MIARWLEEKGASRDGGQRAPLPDAGRIDQGRPTMTSDPPRIYPVDGASAKEPASSRRQPPGQTKEQGMQLNSITSGPGRTSFTARGLRVVAAIAVICAAVSGGQQLSAHLQLPPRRRRRGYGEAGPPGANNWSCRPVPAYPYPVVLVPALGGDVDPSSKQARHYLRTSSSSAARVPVARAKSYI